MSVHISTKQASAPSSQDAAESASPKMDPALKAKWIAALRSGAYPQCDGKLKRDDGFCCLGVLAVVAGYGIDADRDYVLRPDGSRMNEDSYGPFDELGVTPKIRTSLIGMNDRGKPFSKIADYIERGLA